MAQYYKPKEDIINDKVLDYFYLNPFNKYEVIYLVNDDDYNDIINLLHLNNILVIGKDINDDNPLYLNLKLLNDNNIIYLREWIDMLNDESIKSYICNFKGIIICNIDLVDYLYELGLVKKDLSLNKKEYLLIDRYGKVNSNNI